MLRGPFEQQGIGSVSITPMALIRRASAEWQAFTGELVDQLHQPQSPTIGLGVSGFLCEAGYPSCVHEALLEHDGELCLCLGPLSRRAFPFRGGVIERRAAFSAGATRSHISWKMIAGFSMALP